MVTEQDVIQRWEELADDEERILFIVGGAGSGKSKLIRDLSVREGWMKFNAKDLVEEDILLVPHTKRQAAVQENVCKILGTSKADVILLDDVEILFAPILCLDPVTLLKSISTKFPLVVGWKGRREDGYLFLEHNNNPDYYKHTIEHGQHVISVG